VFPGKRGGYTLSSDPRDEAGARALGELQDRGVNLAANALAQSADHILSFLVMLRTELAFYLGCANLHRQLERKKVAVRFPIPGPPGTRTHSCVELRDVCLALTVDRAVVGNDLNADDKKLCIITGANQGGKSTFLRGIGLAQLMMQCGMFVAAKSFSADICRGLSTHYKREEDTQMKSGKFDEELARMSGIVDALTPDSLLLFNESFAATNER
jgi:DNA mismatch repair ATPase MutS